MNTNSASKFPKDEGNKQSCELTNVDSEQELKRLLLLGKERGYITYDELN
ncbi:MAG: hypothetical protein LBO02_03885, partial [Holosporaceae bacterium]|nr:hypothetical protein [Holosporaceae bacterium]